MIARRTLRRTPRQNSRFAVVSIVSPVIPASAPIALGARLYHRAQTFRWCLAAFAIMGEFRPLQEEEFPVSSLSKSLMFKAIDSRQSSSGPTRLRLWNDRNVMGLGR
jgi:hypothetical protein